MKMRTGDGTVQRKHTDIFDRIMELPALRMFEPYYKKHKEGLLYLFFGGLTFVVGMSAFFLFYHALGENELLANVLSWVIGVLFAFFTNRIWVFPSREKEPFSLFHQMLSFFEGRIATLILEEIILLIFVTWLDFSVAGVKIAAQVVVIVSNYFISKWFVFKSC